MHLLGLDAFLCPTINLGILTTHDDVGILQLTSSSFLVKPGVMALLGLVPFLSPTSHSQFRTLRLSLF
jgi:hypothetical protein